MTNLNLKPFIILFVFSLGIRYLTALPQQHPYTMDEAYSYVNAVTLVQGQGFIENFVWNYLNPPETIPHPGNLYWMPLTSLIAAVGLWLGGLSYDAAQWGFIFLSALMPPLSYWISWQVTGQTRQAWLAGLMMVFSGFYFWAWTVVDNFTPFALAGSLALYLTWRGYETGQRNRFFLAGLLLGLAHLARADGPLLLIAIALFMLMHSGRKAGQSRAEKSRLIGKQVGLLAVGYLVVMLPWFGRNLQVTGSLLAPGGDKTLWLQSYNDLFSYGRTLTWQSYVDWGFANILDAKLWALGQNLQRVLAETGLIFALPLAILGGWQLRRHPLFQLVWLYFGLLFVAMTFVFTYPGVRGALFHSGGAVLPFVLIAAVVGLDRLVGAVARKRRTWRLKPAQTVFGIGLVGLAIMLTLIIFSGQVAQSQQTVEQVYAEIIPNLAEPDTVVMVGNPPAFLYYGGERAIIIPNEPLDTVLTVADRYQATYLILDPNHPPTLADYYAGRASHPRLQQIKMFPGPTYLYHILP